MSDREDWNSNIIEEFRANEGKVGGPFDGAPLLLLHTTGARSGEEHDQLYAEQSRRYPQFAKYQEGTDRTIPVVILEPV